MSYRNQYAFNSYPKNDQSQNRKQVVFTDSSDTIEHHGVKGMKWGQHIFGKIYEKAMARLKNSNTISSARSVLKSSINKRLKIIKKATSASKLSSSSKSRIDLSKTKKKTVKSKITKATDAKKKKKATKKKTAKKKATKKEKVAKVKNNRAIKTGTSFTSKSVTSGANASKSNSERASSARKGVANGLDRFAYNNKNNIVSQSLVKALQDLSNLEKDKKKG